MTTSSPARQVWLSRLQVINWGVFDGYHDLHLSRNGTLITGASGSGKSSLLDAVSLAFLAASRRNFNASSDSTAAGSNLGKRTVDKYIRGLWGERQEAGERAKPMYLRGSGPAWSAVAITYTGSDDTVITGLVLKWLAAGADTDASSSYHLINADADILELCNTWRDKNYARSVFESAGWRGKRDNERWYLDQLYTRIGIHGSTAALQLLGKAKSLKSVGGLEQFVRDYMLDTPESITGIRDAVEAITPLVDARKALGVAQSKRRVLGDIEIIHDRYVTESAQLASIGIVDKQMVHDWVDELRLAAIGPEVSVLDADIEQIGAERDELNSKNRVLVRTRDELTARIAKAGSGLSTLRHELAVAEDRADTTSRRRHDYDTQIFDLGWAAPQVQSADDFDTMRAMAQTEIVRIAEELKALRERLANEEGPRRVAARDQMTAAREELARVERLGTSVPANEDRIRGEIAAALGAPAKQLRYVCELLDLKAEYTPWRTAVEKVLRTTGLVLLVPDRYHREVLRYVNDHHMRGLVRLEHVPAGGIAPIAPQSGTLAECLGLTDAKHESAGTATRLIAKVGDYVRVSGTDEFPHHRRAITVEGLYKESETRSVKDDRATLSASQYIYQGDIAAKITALRIELEDATADFEASDAAMTELHNTIESLSIGRDRWNTLHVSFTMFSDIDTDGADTEVRRLQEQLEALEAANPDLAKLENQAEDLLDQSSALTGRISILTERETASDDRRTKLLDLQETLKPGVVGSSARAALEIYRGQLSIPLEILAPAPYKAELVRAIEKDQGTLQDSVNRLTNELKRIISNFDAQFEDAIPNNSEDLDEKIHDYVALCRRIDDRELPQAHDRMLRLITEQAPMAALHLYQKAEEEAQHIEEQIARVNRGLGSVEFNRGTRLSLHADPKKLTAVTDLHERARRISGRSLAVSMRDEKATHDQYRDILELRNLLASDSAEARQWTRDALDVRNRFTLYCAETDSTTGALIRTYSNAGANSGGEQEKLMAFCLAGALSFNLADPSTGDNRPVFSQLMLDEAFSKSDPVFADQALSAFRKFGFQLLIVATVQNTTTIQPYIDSVVMVSKRDTPGTEPIASTRTVTVREFAEISHELARTPATATVR
ncbi:ATP-binding protein [Mycobacterium avium]|uniref:ATP-binding protein n=4 Tax=Mycobacterium avium complex (MAC) TaxID=120793 RepID=UPI0007A0D5AA|nr:ATP-binding protein [Mycobacterium avium]MDV3219407.1 AAA family ATPase [Mycobacterium avium]